ncbi:hypothetical protein [uncultured Methanobrevibacter sp.]|uniref:hypothetical protein n=1 Tax=uncultured Methanobrevibacter sp. TaxID=253161 RepID=UPI00260A0EA2|nr:hypothetical protein [uncultured Methanobrevibacter sp.]
MNHSKIILVACISAFVAITTAVLGVAGTIIGSVLSSVLYNVLSEALQKPVDNAKLKANFEWEIAYSFPLIVMALIQLLLIFAMLSEMGLLPSTFLNVYLSLQNVADNNLYRVLGFSLLVMSVYPFVLTPDFIKKSHGGLIAFIGLIFLAKGFCDSGFLILYYIFHYFDFPIALIAFILLSGVIYKILISANGAKSKIKTASMAQNRENIKFKQVHPRKMHVSSRNNREEYNRNKQVKHNVRRNQINKSSEDIHFETNEFLDDYKK